MAISTANVKVVLERIKTEKQRMVAEGKTIYDTSSQKDETEVMRAMLNDSSYVNGIYNNTGCIGVTCPAVQFRRMLVGIICDNFHLDKAEVEYVLGNYNFGNATAEQMISIAKQFVIGYLESGRKLPFGQRRNSDISMTMKRIPAHNVFHPIKRIHDDGKCETMVTETMVPQYDQIRVSSKCPAWKKYIEKRDEIKPDNKLHPDNSMEKYKDYPSGMDEKAYKDGKLIVMEVLK